MDRSGIMRAVKGKNTGPEMFVRRLAHSMGYRFRVHRRDLPGQPDLVFPARRKIIFVHGCWWHGHNCKRGARQPKSNSAYWIKKIARNVERDARNEDALQRAGWDVLVVWQCELKDAVLSHRLEAFLNPSRLVPSPPNSHLAPNG